MTPDEMRAAPVDDVCCGENTCDSSFDDEDFYEAIDLLETCRKQILRVMSDVGPGRQYILSHLADDVKQFIDTFIVAAPDGEESCD